MSKTYYTFTNRYALAHLSGKCRRKIILEYFEEECDLEDAIEHCCDVCQQDCPTRDHKEEMIAIVKAVDQIPDKGEKKVV